MPNFVDFLVFLGMVFLRFGVPLLIVLGIGYLLKQLDQRWEAEAREYAAKQAAQQPGIRPEAPRPVERPAVPVRTPAEMPQMPFIIPPPAAIKDTRLPLAQPGLMATPPQACWDAKKCSADKKAQCAAPQHPDQPCWQARFDAEGRVPKECVGCDIFQRYPMM